MSVQKAHLVRAQAILALGKRVLFVEGKDDAAVYTKWLAAIDPVFGNRLELVATGGNNDLDAALASLGHPPDAYALRDRDEWNVPRIAGAQTASPRLLVNASRHCLESYFCDPDEVAPVLVTHDPGQYGPAEAFLRAALSAPLASWVDHWAMWTTAMQLQEDMVSAGYASFFHDRVPLPSDADIQSQLGSWATLADAGLVWTPFSDLRAMARAKPVVDRYRSCVHGKKYWEAVVLPALRAVENRPDWLLDLADWSPVPPDLEPLLRTVLP